MPVWKPPGRESPLPRLRCQALSFSTDTADLCGLCLFLLSLCIKIYLILHLRVFCECGITITRMQCHMGARRGRQVLLER